MGLHDRRPPLVLAALLFALGLGGGSARAAGGAAEPPSLSERLAELEQREAHDLDELQAIADNAEHRVGLMSRSEARARYEDAVFASLMGDYERAALEFSILTESGALGTGPLAADAEWALGEALFALQDYELAAEVYRRIAERGPGAPFFSDAVRRLLEIYGIRGDQQAFDELYRRAIASGQVKPTELIQYTLAKSFYRQGDWVKAKDLFTDFPEDSPYYSRARYFLGTILVLQGKLEDALPEFARAAEAPVPPGDERAAEVRDLANLAQGRVYYELGRYQEASDAYLKIGRDSKYFADQLYELVWTFIKQGEYEEAIQAAEVFLLAFPEHQYAAQLKVYKGHLEMKQEHYESALSNYEKVIAEYSPIRDLVSAVEVSQEQPAIFFQRLVDEQALDALNQAGLPPYAVEMLLNVEDVKRTVEARRELEEQRRELERTQQVARDLEGILGLSSETLGTFRDARQSLQWVLKDRLDVIDSLLSIEEELLAQQLSGPDKRRLEQLRERRKVVAEAALDARSEAPARDRYELYREQLRAVQSEASLVAQVAQDLLRDLAATRDVLELSASKMDPEEYQQVRKDMAALQQRLEQALRELKPLQSEQALLQMVGLDQQRSEVELVTAADRAVLQDYSALREEYRSLRRGITDPAAKALFRRIDAVWDGMDELERRGQQVLATMDRVEEREVTRIRQGLAAEESRMHVLDGELASATREADVLGAQATREGFHELAEFFEDSVMRADMGIVDVYWARKIQVSDRIDELNRERVEILKELDRRYQWLHDRLKQ